MDTLIILSFICGIGAGAIATIVFYEIKSE
jgi:hypothetical protein